MRNVIILALIAAAPWLALTTVERLGLRVSFAHYLVTLEGDSNSAERSPPEWDDFNYLRKNPDVAAAVRRGELSSGWQHWLMAGKKEGRHGGFPSAMQAASVESAAEAPSPTSTHASPAPAPLSASPPLSVGTPPPQPSAPVPVPVPTMDQVPQTEASTVALPSQPTQVAPGQYVVRDGGRLATVAEVTGVALADLLALNPGARSWLAAGTVIRLPTQRSLLPVAPLPGIKPEVQTPFTSRTPSPVPAVTSRVPTPQAVIGMRVGESGKELRVVLDLSEPARVRPVVKITGRKILVELANSVWKAAPQSAGTSSHSIESYRTVTTSATGVHLELHTRSPLSLVRTSTLPAAESRGHRIVLDFHMEKPTASR